MKHSEIYRSQVYQIGKKKSNKSAPKVRSTDIKTLLLFGLALLGLLSIIGMVIFGG